MAKELIVANWKMNPGSFKAALKLAAETKKAANKSKKAEVVICPPFVYLEKLRTKIKLGAQDLFYENPSASGAYTGEISAKMLKNLGVQYVIVGHSERRNVIGETDEMINKKLKAALKAGLKPILCVGEPWEVKQKGESSAEKFIDNQLKKDLDGIKNLKLKIKNLAVAYEPVWAIGTGKAENPADAISIIGFIRRTLSSMFHVPSFKVLYGGSVSSKNIIKFIKSSEVDGALVGAASVNGKEMKKIIELTNE